jgi:hypothetical protein
MSTKQFLPFDPKLMRRLFAAGAALAFLLAASAMADPAAHQGPGRIRMMLLLALTAAFAWVVFRLRPRRDWGIVLDDLSLAICTPFGRKAHLHAWPEISAVRHEGKRSDVLVIFFNRGEPVVVSHWLFANRAAFEEASNALKQRVSSRVLDA